MPFVSRFILSLAVLSTTSLSKSQPTMLASGQEFDMAGEHLADAAVRLMSLWRNEEDAALVPIMGHFLLKEQDAD